MEQRETAMTLPYVPLVGEDRRELAALRARTRALRSDRGIELLRFRESVAMLEHKDLEKGASFQRRLDDIGITEGAPRENWNRMLVTTEGERRRHLRRPFAVLLATPQIRKLQQVIREIVEQAFDEIENLSRADLMQALAWKVPSRVYCHLVAAPTELAPLAARLSDSTLAPILTVDASRRQEAIDAFAATYDFVRDHLAQRRRAGLGEDFASIMIRQHEEGLQTEEELIYEGIALLQASVDNTVHQIGLVLGTLLEDPRRWAAIVEDEDLVTPGVEEAMRLNPRFGTIFRYAPADTQVEGIPVAADTWVFASLRSASRDEEIFDDPDAFRFDRNQKRALQFGGGPYSCLGQGLARLEINEVIRVMRERFPRARLAGEWSRHVTNAVTETRDLHASLQ